MATYKVLQDVEAEDKLIGPLTFRQFVYAGIAALCGYLTFLVVTKGAPYLAAIFFPIAAASAFFAWPWGGEQPTEVWALAKIRYYIKPRKRIWDQDGVKNLVTVTAPKKIEIDYTNGLSQTEVRSRLRALADTIDSRGWAIKNSNLNAFAQPALIMAEPSSDRLLAPSTLPQPVANTDVQASDDMLDELNNPHAKQVGDMVEASAKAHRQKIIDSLQAPEPQPSPIPKPAAPNANNYWFLNQPSPAASIPGNNMVTFNTQVVTPGVPRQAALPNPVGTIGAPEERQLVEELKARKNELPTTAYYGHLHTIQPISAQSTARIAPQQPIPVAAQTQQPVQATPQAIAPAQQQAPEPRQPAVTPKQQAAILQLANNDDLNVATIAREAQRSGEQNEVVIKLH